MMMLLFRLRGRRVLNGPSCLLVYENAPANVAVR